MRSILRYQTFACAALILWLLASWSGVHGHFCFDGQEPPLAVHMKLLADHSDHSGDEQHTDADVSPGELALIKVLKLDLVLLLATALLLALAVSIPAVFSSYYTLLNTSLHPFALRPPLRAPPAFSA